MTRDELLIEISNRTNINYEKVESVILTLSDVILEECKKENESVFIPKLGRFRGHVRKESIRYNLKTKSTNKVSPFWTIKFKALPSVKKQI